MLARYRIHRGKRPPDDPLPGGVRQDTRKHTRHVLRPEPNEVARYLADPSDAAWERFARAYRALLARRRGEFAQDFDDLAGLARQGDLWLG